MDLTGNISQVNSDFANIKNSIISYGVDVPEGTPTSEYGYLVKEACDKAFNDGSQVYEEVIEPLDEAVSKTLEYANLGGSDAGASLREKITFINNNIPNVYSTGELNGRGIGESIGREAEWSDFWDVFQNNGSDNNYRYAFYNWNKNIYNPKYPIKAHNQNSQVFYYFGGESTKVPITLKGATSQFFSNSYVISIPLLDVDETVNFNDTATPIRENYHAFYSCTKLENLTLSGVIAKNLWISKSPLTKDSILGIEVTYSKIEVGKILQTDYSNFGLRVDSHTTNDSGDVTSIVVTPVQSEEQYATYPISKLDEVSVTFNLVKIGENYYWGGILGALKDYSADTSGTQHILTLGADNLEKLQAPEQAIATEKGWTLI